MEEGVLLVVVSRIMLNLSVGKENLQIFRMSPYNAQS